MRRIVVFGAGGRAGRAVAAEARRRGHQVTAVVRHPARHPGLAADGIAAGDVTDPADVARVAAGHDAAVHAAVDLTADPGTFFPAAAHALLDGLPRAGVGRLVTVGLASVLDTAAGTPLMDTPGYPQEYRSFYLGHAAGTAVLRAAETDLDWLVLSPAGDFDHAAAGTGRHRLAPADAASRISYPDFAVAVVDEIENPTHHRIHLGIEAG
ncbi:NAD(P)H-binding protein [Catellatospora sp. KI3]|uniref:NAD(P)-dependent oxidoreductase n=1 Tax=Catellatospora sp. KI3 TaxID=3041620 RepID=UPI0024829D8C|nr:NAD(P)H-binding protein [Catellatospora sp. KI3]MDI1465338.1 NAD(P)H-binding protein [Catellatospora sp. KI3]